MAEPTIKALRVLQIGVEAVAATRVLTMDTQPTANDTITIGTVTYTWKASGAVSGEINRGADLPAAKLNLVAAINGTDIIQAGANPHVTAAAFTSNTMTVTARIPGPIGNAIATTETFTAVTNIWAGTTLTGGAHAHGTPVAATTKLAVEEMAFPNDSEKLYQPKVQNGNLTRFRGAGVAVEHGADFTLSSQAAIWDHFILWLSGMFGGPTVTGPLGGPYDCVWTMAENVTPDPYSFTLERRRSNGLGDTIDERAAYCMLPEWELSFAVNEDLKMAGSKGFAKAWSAMGGGITAAQTLPDFEVAVSALSEAFSDALFANVGDTKITAQVIGWTVKFMSGIFARFTAEGNTGLDFTRHQFNGEIRGIDLDLTCLLDPTRYAIEVARSSTPANNRFANRIRVTGSEGRELTIDASVQHTAPLPPLSDNEGSDVVTYALAENPDGTNFMVITLTLPDIPTLT